MRSVEQGGCRLRRGGRGFVVGGRGGVRAIGLGCEALRVVVVVVVVVAEGSLDLSPGAVVGTGYRRRRRLLSLTRSCRCSLVREAHSTTLASWRLTHR